MAALSRTHFNVHVAMCVLETIAYWMHFARGFKRLFQPFNAATTTTIGELYCHPRRYISHCHSFRRFARSFIFSLLPLFCMLFSPLPEPYALRRWLSAFYAAFSSLFLLKSDYFNCVHCLLFVFSRIFFNIRSVACVCEAQLIGRWWLNGCIVKLIEIQYITSNSFLPSKTQSDTKYNKTLSYYLKSAVLESQFSAPIN